MRWKTVILPAGLGVIVAVVLLVVLRNNNGGGSKGGGGYSFAGDVEAIISTKCSSCHVAEHHNLITYPERRGNCFSCHDGSGPGSQNTEYAYPPLITEEDVRAAVARGTFKSWLMPGGFMAWDGNPVDMDGTPYPPGFPHVRTNLSPKELAILTNWADSISSDRTLGYNPYLVAASIKNADFIPDGTGTNSAWADATELTVTLTPTIYTPVSEVKLKALYSNTYLYIRVEYSDSTMSLTRAGWLWDEGPGTWKTAARNPKLIAANDIPSEDRVAFLWNMNIPDFKASYGCAVKCHGNKPGYSCFTDVVNTQGDTWHTKAARSLGAASARINSALTINPLTHEATSGSATFMGWLDDKHLDWYYAPGFDTEDSGRRGDAGSSTYSRNRNAAKTAPLYMESAPTDYVDAMILRKTEIGVETIVSDPDNAAYAGDAAVSAAWAAYLALDAVVPERILNAPTGSRADVTDAATWTNGVWIHEIKRALDTGNKDDIIFSDLNAIYEFSIALFDNCGRGEMPPGHTTYGNGQYLVLCFE